MRTRRMYGWMVLGCLLVVAPTWALPMGTAFTYQGFLEKPAGTPLTDTCDFRFYLIDAPMAGNIVGDSPQVATGVSVASGNFSVEIDFGASAFTGEGRWMTIEVRCTSDGAYVPMTPAVELTPAPYALALPGLRTPETATVPNVIGGGLENVMFPGVEGGTIAGGGFIPNQSQQNTVLGDYGTVGGGTGNTAQMFGTVAGGNNNHADGTSSAVGGGEINIADSAHATVGGGTFNSATAVTSTVGGGHGNGASGESSTVGGGFGNGASGEGSTVGGGKINDAIGENGVVAGGRDNSAEGLGSSIGGGHQNSALDAFATVAGGLMNFATGNSSAVGGGQSNATRGAFSTVPGGSSNIAGGSYSFAAGRQAKVRDAATVGNSDGDQGTFVWADASGLDFVSTGANQFLIRAGGGVGINTNSPSSELEVAGDMELSGSMFVDAGTLVVDHPNHRVGIGTFSPTEKLHVAGNVRISNSLTVDNNLLVVDHTSNRVGVGTVSPSSTLDVVGASELNGALTVDTSTLVVDAVNDRVGVGTASPSSKLEIAAQDGLAITGFQPFLTLRDTNASNARARIANASGSFSFFPESYIGGSAAVVIVNTTGRLGIGDDTPDVALDVVGDIHYTGVITDVSDERLKEDIRPVESALDKVSRLRGVTFAMKGSSAAREAGLIAQDVEAVLPEAVRVVDEAEGHLGVSYAGVTSLLVEAVKEVRAELHCASSTSEIEELGKRIGEKEHKILELEQRNAALEARLSRIESTFAVMGAESR